MLLPRDHSPVATESIPMPLSVLGEMTGESYYRAFVQVPPEELEKLGEALSINPGMPAEVLIMTGERTLFQSCRYP